MVHQPASQPSLTSDETRSGLVPDRGDDPLNIKNAQGADGKWRSTPLKSSWYEDHVGFDAAPLERAENRVRNFEARFWPANDEGGAARDVERFFDLFEPSGG